MQHYWLNERAVIGCRIVLEAEHIRGGTLSACASLSICSFCWAFVCSVTGKCSSGREGPMRQCSNDHDLDTVSACHWSVVPPPRSRLSLLHSVPTPSAQSARRLQAPAAHSHWDIRNLTTRTSCSKRSALRSSPQPCICRLSPEHSSMHVAVRPRPLIPWSPPIEGASPR